jgi:CheY-like chemotaxis protein
MLMSRPVLEGCLVLVVEDEPFISIYVTDVLNGAGASVTAANTLEQGLTLVELEGLSAAIIDHTLPDGNSQQLCTRLKQRGIPFVIFSGYPSLGGECAGAAHLGKPASEQQVVQAVAALIRSGNGTH